MQPLTFSCDIEVEIWNVNFCLFDSWGVWPRVTDYLDLVQGLREDTDAGVLDDSLPLEETIILLRCWWTMITK